MNLSEVKFLLLWKIRGEEGMMFWFGNKVDIEVKLDFFVMWLLFGWVLFLVIVFD